MINDGYDKHYKHEVVYESGPYTGRDDEWSAVGIPSHVLAKLGWTFRVEDNIKKAIISFNSRNYAFWFQLTRRRH